MNMRSLKTTPVNPRRILHAAAEVTLVQLTPSGELQTSLSLRLEEEDVCPPIIQTFELYTTLQKPCRADHPGEAVANSHSAPTTTSPMAGEYDGTAVGDNDGAVIGTRDGTAIGDSDGVTDGICDETWPDDVYHTSPVPLPPITHIASSNETLECRYRALHAASEVACVHVNPSKELHTSLSTEQHPPKTHIAPAYTTLV